MPSVMVIDDDVVVTNLLETLLEMEGYDVITYKPGDDLPDIIVQKKPDLVLMDVYLKTSLEEDADGLEILKQIRIHPEISTTKVIMSSGLDAQIKSEEFGANAFILKPYMPEDLINVIKQIL